MDDAASLKKPKQKNTLSAAVARSLREGTLWVLGAIALILLLGAEVNAFFAEDVLSEKAFRVRVGNCFLHDVEKIAILPAQIGSIRHPALPIHPTDVTKRLP